jgi:hypothetical protein
LSLTIYESDCIVECLPQALRSPASHQQGSEKWPQEVEEA